MKKGSYSIEASGITLIELLIGAIMLAFVLFLVSKTSHGISAWACTFMEKIFSFFSGLMGGGEISVC